LTKAKMMYARELIKEKRYDEARIILREIDHPKAKEWLNKLDTLHSQNKGNAKSKSTIKRSRISGTIVIALLFLIAFASIAFWILDSDSQIPTASTTSKPTALPARVCDEADLVGCYADQMRNVITSQGGSIESFDNEVNSNKRIVSSVEVRLSSGPSSVMARQMIEQVLRTYAATIPTEHAGSLYIGVFWTSNNQQCSDNAGMGFETMDSIDWKRATQRSIFAGIDRNIYGDGDAHYSQIGFAPDPSVFPECNR
jgi:hypothetical protein